MVTHASDVELGDGDERELRGLRDEHVAQPRQAIATDFARLRRSSRGKLVAERFEPKRLGPSPALSRDLSRRRER